MTEQQTDTSDDRKTYFNLPSRVWEASRKPYDRVMNPWNFSKLRQDALDISVDVADLSRLFDETRNAADGDDLVEAPPSPEEQIENDLKTQGKAEVERLNDLLTQISISLAQHLAKQDQNSWNAFKVEFLRNADATIKLLASLSKEARWNVEPAGETTGSLSRQLRDLETKLQFVYEKVQKEDELEQQKLEVLIEEAQGDSPDLDDGGGVTDMMMRAVNKGIRKEEAKNEEKDEKKKKVYKIPSTRAEQWFTCANAIESAFVTLKNDPFFKVYGENGDQSFVDEVEELQLDLNNYFRVNDKKLTILDPDDLRKRLVVVIRKMNQILKKTEQYLNEVKNIDMPIHEATQGVRIAIFYTLITAASALGVTGAYGGYKTIQGIRSIFTSSEQDPQDVQNPDLKQTIDHQYGFDCNPLQSKGKIEITTPTDKTFGQDFDVWFGLEGGDWQPLSKQNGVSAQSGSITYDAAHLKNEKKIAFIVEYLGTRPGESSSIVIELK